MAYTNLASIASLTSTIHSPFISFSHMAFFALQRVQVHNCSTAKVLLLQSVTFLTPLSSHPYPKQPIICFLSPPISFACSRMSYKWNDIYPFHNWPLEFSIFWMIHVIFCMYQSSFFYSCILSFWNKKNHILNTLSKNDILTYHDSQIQGYHTLQHISCSVLTQTLLYVLCPQNHIS